MEKVKLQKEWHRQSGAMRRAEDESAQLSSENSSLASSLQLAKEENARLSRWLQEEKRAHEGVCRELEKTRAARVELLEEVKKEEKVGGCDADAMVVCLEQAFGR